MATASSPHISPASASTTSPLPQPPSATDWNTPATASALLDAAASSRATTLATRAMTLFVRRNISAEQWWKDLSPLLTPQAQQAYVDTDPRNVPPTKITSAARLTPGSLPLTARVSIGTDAGVYLVILTRSSGQSPWQVDRIVPPETVGAGA